jgi:hypothetical protein
MNRIRTAVVSVVAATAVLAAAAPGAGAHPGHGAPHTDKSGASKRVLKQLAQVRRATTRFRDVEAAKAAGYQPTDECVDTRLGAMGFHYVNPGLVADPALEPKRPEILLYVEGRDGRLHLGGVEYFVLDTGQPTPRILGRRLDGPMTHGGTAPSHYDLHVWIFERNPRGVFAQYNPRFRCK